MLTNLSMILQATGKFALRKLPIHFLQWLIILQELFTKQQVILLVLLMQHGVEHRQNHGQAKKYWKTIAALHVSLTAIKSNAKSILPRLKNYKTELEKWKAILTKPKPAAPREPVGPHHSKSPYKLYNGMIAPVISYTIKGVIWYQGEDNAERAAQYRRLFPAMIENWRNDFSNEKMPFYFVQISPHRSQNPEIRDAQLYTFRTVPYTGMAVTTDNGDSLDIHPRNKKLVGESLALWALKNDYGKKEIVASGPLYKSMKKEGNKITIQFDYADGLEAKDGELKEFTIAGDDENFVPAKATIEGNRVVVWSDAVQNPVAVRFAWKNVPFPNLI